MALTIGTQLGSYEITALVGKGGRRPVIDESKLFFERAFADITVAAEKENFSGHAALKGKAVPTVAGARMKYRDGSLVD
jgi:hypothetical protein